MGLLAWLGLRGKADEQQPQPAHRPGSGPRSGPGPVYVPGDRATMPGPAHHPGNPPASPAGSPRAERPVPVRAAVPVPPMYQHSGPPLAPDAYGQPPAAEASPSPRPVPPPPVAAPAPVPVRPRRHAEDPWAPVVVDQPIVEFEPRPARPTYRPLTSSYRPDSIVDGWSSEHFTVRAASVRGYAHRYDGTPRQDDLAVAAHPATRAVVFAVADGVSAAEHSHIGATVACRAAVDSALDQLDRGSEGINWQQLVNGVAWQLVEHAKRMQGLEGPDSAAAERLLATTLVVGAVVPGPDGYTATLVQLGDSGVWQLHAGRYTALGKAKIEAGAAVFSSAVSALPRVPPSVGVVEVRLAAEAVLLVGTDGIGDPLGDGSGKVGELFARMLAQPPPPLALAHLLDFSRDTFDDDRTLIAIWQRPGR